MSGIYGRAGKAPLLSLVHGMAGMRRGLDFAKAETAFKRAAEKAVHGTREERSGRFLPAKKRASPPAKPSALDQRKA
jgi:hypothetical protein